uniref:Uncharacterized protein n=1 Tax=Amphora coffeiformis TaxID=265554 RepID=A0A7S3PD49_9STRA
MTASVANRTTASARSEEEGERNMEIDKTEQLRNKIETRLVAMVGEDLVKQYGPYYPKSSLTERIQTLTSGPQLLFSELKDTYSQEASLLRADETMQQQYSDDMLLRAAEFAPFPHDNAVESLRRMAPAHWNQLSAEELGPALLATRAVVPLPSVTTLPANDHVVYICPSQFQAYSDPLRLISYVLNSNCGRHDNQTTGEVALLINMKEYKFGSSTSAQQSFALEDWIGLVELMQGRNGPARVSQVFTVETSTEVAHVYAATLLSRSQDGFGSRVNFVSKVEDLGQYLTNPAAWPRELNGEANVADLVQDFVTYRTALEQILQEDLPKGLLSPVKSLPRSIDSTDEDSTTSSDDDASRFTVVQIPEPRKKSRNVVSCTGPSIDPPSAQTDEKRNQIDRSSSPQRVTRRYKLSIENPALQRMDLAPTTYFCELLLSPTRKLSRRSCMQRGESLPTLLSPTRMNNRSGDEVSGYNGSRNSHDRVSVPVMPNPTLFSSVSDCHSLVQSPVKTKTSSRRRKLQMAQSLYTITSPRIHDAAGNDSTVPQSSSPGSSTEISRRRDYLRRSQSALILAPSKHEKKQATNNKPEPGILSDRPHIYRANSVPGLTSEDPTKKPPSLSKSDGALKKETSSRASKKQSKDRYNLLCSRPIILEPGMEILDVTANTVATCSETNEESVISEETSSKTSPRRRLFQRPKKTMNDDTKKQKQGLFSRLFGRGSKTAESKTVATTSTIEMATNTSNTSQFTSDPLPSLRKMTRDNQTPKVTSNKEPRSSIFAPKEIVAMAPQEWHARRSVPSSSLPRRQRMFTRSSSVQAFPSSPLSTILEDSSARGTCVRPKIKKAQSARDNRTAIHYATLGDVIITAKPFAPEHTTQRVMATWGTTDQLDLPSTDYGVATSQGAVTSESRRSKMYRTDQLDVPSTDYGVATSQGAASSRSRRSKMYRTGSRKLVTL